MGLSPTNAQACYLWVEFSGLSITRGNPNSLAVSLRLGDRVQKFGEAKVTKMCGTEYEKKELNRQGALEICRGVPSSLWLLNIDLHMWVRKLLESGETTVWKKQNNRQSPHRPSNRSHFHQPEWKHSLTCEVSNSLQKSIASIMIPT